MKIIKLTEKEKNKILEGILTTLHLSAGTHLVMGIYLERDGVARTYPAYIEYKDFLKILQFKKE